MQFESSASFAQRMDADDPLAAFQDQFHMPLDQKGQKCIYLCGNSLGLQPKSVRESIEQELQDWQTFGVEGHFHAKNPWMRYHELLAEPMARLVGAKPLEVVVMNTLTVNLHLLMVSFYRPTAKRYKILIEASAFPSDQYAVKSQLHFHGYHPDDALIEVQPDDGQAWISTEKIEAVLAQQGHEIALVLLGGVNYYSGQAFDMARITAAAHTQGCVVGFDLAHAAGNVMLHLHDWQVDFAVWCSYKYLNAGPGSTAGCFVHERHANAVDLPRFAGWWGHDKATRFKMGPDFQPIAGAEGWQLSNPAILPLAALRASMAIFDEAGMANLCAKSEKLTGYLEFLIEQIGGDAVESITPKQPEARGAQLSLRLARDGKAVFDRLSARGVVCDWREPDVIRIAPVPLYNSFTDVYRFVEIMKEEMHGLGRNFRRS